MVAYSFKKRFGPPILAGTKAQTIRGDRKRHARPGEPVQLFTGMRTKYCKRLGDPTCRSVNPIRIEFPRAQTTPEILIFEPDGSLKRRIVEPTALARFAQADGFTDFDDMHAFWCAEHPGTTTFNGILICWTPLTPA